MDEVQRLAADLGDLLDGLLIEAGPSYVRAAQRRGLNAAQTQLLLALAEGAGAMPLDALAHRTQRSVTSASRLIARLRRHGLVSHDDTVPWGRERRVELTGSGRALLRTLKSDRRQRLERYVAAMPRTQRLRLAGALHLLSRRLDDDLAHHDLHAARAA